MRSAWKNVSIAPVVIVGSFLKFDARRTKRASG
jgi:hypothetical protein